VGRDQLRDHLGVGLGPEGDAVAAELLAERRCVLDDPVVDDGHTPALVRVRVCVAVRWRPVCRPASVPDADGARQWLSVADELAELLELSCSFQHTDAITLGGGHGDAGRVVTPILQLR